MAKCLLMSFRMLYCLASVVSGYWKERGEGLEDLSSLALTVLEQLAAGGACGSYLQLLCGICLVLLLVAVPDCSLLGGSLGC